MVRGKTPAARLALVLNSEVGTAYLLILPLVLVIVLLLAYPLGYAILLTVQKKAVGIPGVFVGLDNYVRLVQDPVFTRLISNTFIYTAAAVVLKTIVGMGMALLLNERIIGRSIFRALLMIPWVMPQTVVALNWRWILTSTGVLSYVLVKTGLAPKYIGWLGDPTLALLSLIMVNVWANFPFFGINFLASMQTIPRDLYEAAEVDGASVWQRFIHITIPSLRQIMLILSILSFIWTWNMFTHVWVLTQGGPANSTHLFTTYAYQVGLTGQGLGYAATISICFLPVLAIAVGLLSPALMKSREE